MSEQMHETDKESIRSKSRLRKMGRATLETVGGITGMVAGGGLMVAGLSTLQYGLDKDAVGQMISGGVTVAVGTEVLNRLADRLAGPRRELMPDPIPDRREEPVSPQDTLGSSETKG